MNFIYQRKDSIYTPTYASPDKTGSRYYFDKDTLIKWRWVNKPLDVKELVLKRDKKSIAKVQYLYKKSKKKDRKHYDKREIKMLNAAYNTYEAMLKENEYGGITGNIVNTKGKALKDVKIAVYFGAEFVGEITTDKKGKFETGISPNKEGYKLKITKEGFADTEVENVTVKDTDSIVLTDKIMLVKAGEGKKKLKFNVFDAEATKYNNKRAVKKYIDKVKIKVRKGTDNRAGEVIAESKSDNKGNINLSLENGIYTIEFVKKGFVKSYQTIAVEKKSAMNIPLVKKMKKNQLKIVLTWEGDKDIDSSLFTPYQGKGGDMAYIGADTKKDKHGNRLVLDGKQGNTTEVIILDNVKAGNYKYYVSDYTNSRKKKFSSKDMKKLKLKVVVYDENGVVGYYTLPYDVNGVVWEVFEIKNGKLIPLQKTYSNISGKKWWTNDKELIARKAALEKKRLYEIRKFETEILPAYEKYVRENFQGSSLDEPYSFIYLDDDYIPELVIDTGVQASGTNIVTYANRAVGTTVGPNVGYIERYNLLLVVGGHQGEYYDAVYSIRNGDLVEVWRGMWEENVDENGNFIYRYYINSEEVSQEEYRSRLSNLVGNNSMNSGQFIYAPTIREAYAKFKAVKGM